LVRKKLCISCGACAKACPVDAIYLDTTGEPFVCIHCGKCVPYCPHDCLEHAEFSRGATPLGIQTADAEEVEL